MSFIQPVLQNASRDLASGIAASAPPIDLRNLGFFPQSLRSSLETQGVQYGSGRLDDIGSRPTGLLDGTGAAPATRHITADPSPVSERSYDAGSLYGTSGQPQSGDVEQNAIGDCYFDSTMMALAEKDPSVIKNAIQYNPDTGNYTVTFHEEHQSGWWIFGSTETREVKVEVTQTELKDNIQNRGSSSTLDNGNSTGAAWPAVLETAYAKLHDSNPANGLDEGYGKINGGFPSDAMFTLTGKKADQIDLAPIGFVPPQMQQEGIYNQVSQALQDGRGVTLWTYKENGSKQDGLVDDHVYTVERIYKDANGEVLVDLRNPWGSNNNIEGTSTDGAVVTRKLSDLMSTGGGHAFNITGK